MQILSKVESQYYSWPVRHASTDIVDGAALMRGTTGETDLGVLVIASSAAADLVGFHQGLLDASEVTDTAVAGTYWNLRQVAPAFSGVIVRAEYDQSDTMAIASMQSTSIVRVTSIEDGIDTGWLYCVSGTGIGELHFITADDATDLTVKSASTYAATDTLIKILPLFHPLAKLNTAADKLGTDAAAGSWTIAVMQNWIDCIDRRMQILNPTVHEGLTGLNAAGKGTRFFADLLVRNTIGYTID